MSKKAEKLACELVLCEDENGRIVVKPKSGTCPPGYVEKMHKKAGEQGIVFLKPKVSIEEEPEEQTAEKE